MEQKTVHYYNDGVMNTCYVSDIVLHVLHVLTLRFSTTGWLHCSYFAEGEMGTQRLSNLLRVIELIPKRQSQDLNPGRLAPEPRLWTTMLDHLLFVQSNQGRMPRGSTRCYKNPEMGFPMQLVERGQGGLPGRMGPGGGLKEEGWSPRLRRG